MRHLVELSDSDHDGRPSGVGAAFQSLAFVIAWKGGRAVECSGLENRQAGNPRLGGSNPPPSVTLKYFSPGPARAVVPAVDSCLYRAKCRVLEIPGPQNGILETIHLLGLVEPDSAWLSNLRPLRRCRCGRRSTA